MKKLSKNLNGNRGLTLVEVLIATSIILVFMVALFGVHNLYLKTAFSNRSIVKAAQLAEEGLEAVRFLRDSSWDTNIASLSLDTDYYPAFTGGGWQITSAKTLLDGVYERKVRFSAVYRDASADIVVSGGTLDPNTLAVVSAVSWLNGAATTTKSISTYITDIFDN